MDAGVPWTTTKKFLMLVPTLLYVLVCVLCAGYVHVSHRMCDNICCRQVVDIVSCGWLQTHLCRRQQRHFPYLHHREDSRDASCSSFRHQLHIRYGCACECSEERIFGQRKGKIAPPTVWVEISGQMHQRADALLYSCIVSAAVMSCYSHID